MSRINKSQFAILGCLSLKPMSAYEIKKFIKGSVAHFWSESEGQLYPALQKLKQEAKITGEEQKGKKNNIKIVYSITEAGRSELQSWLKNGAVSNSIRNEMLMKLFFGSETSSTIVHELLKESLKVKKENLDELMNIKCNADKKKLSKKRKIYIDITLDYGIRLLQAEIEWHVNAIAVLDESLS